MRLGEIKSILDKIVSDNKISILSKSIYGGQGYKIFNFASLMKGLNILRNQEWNSFNGDFLDEFESEDNLYELDIPATKYNNFVQYINNLNTKFPIFYLMLNSFVEKQDEHIINIKLPNIDLNLKKLTNINKELELLFNEINADAEFKFVGFDTGSNWYKILIYGEITYHLFLGGIDLGTKLFQMRTEYYKSEIEKQHYIASLKNGEKENDKDFKEYIEKVIKIQIDSKIDKIVSEIKIGNNNENEIKTKLLKTSEKIAEQLEKGIEFHLSLNPPEYVNENKNVIEIDYEKIREIQVERNKPKEITDQTEEVLEDNAK